MATKPQTIDEYLAGLSPENRAALRKVRRAVHAAAPGAEECISYVMPAFRLNGKLIAGFKAAASHCLNRTGFLGDLTMSRTGRDEPHAFRATKGPRRRTVSTCDICPE